MSYGNQNLMFISDCQYITTGAASDAGAALNPSTRAVTLYATADAWVCISPAPVAAAPSVEKVKVNSFFIAADQRLDVAVPAGTDTVPIKVAAIQATASGNVYICERRD